MRKIVRSDPFPSRCRRTRPRAAVNRATPRRATATLLWLSAALVVLALPPWLTAGRNPLHIDEASWAYVAGTSLATGQPLYAVGHENKLPGIFWLYQAVGAVDEATIGHARAAEGLMVLVTALLLLWWLGREVGPGAGATAGALYALGAAFAQGPRALTEVPLALGTTAGVCLAWYATRRGCFWYLPVCGVALGLAATFKQTAIFDLAAVLLLVACLARGESRFRPLLAASGVLLGFGVVLGAELLYMVLTRQLAEFGQAALLSFLDPASTLSAPWAQRPGRLIAFVRDLYPPLAVPMFLAVLGLTATAGEQQRLRWWGGVWLVAGGLAFLSAGTLYDHQAVQFLPPLALLAGLGWAGLGERLGPTPRWRPLAGAALVLLTFTQLADTYQRAVHANLRNLAAPPVTTEAQWGRWLAGVLAPEDSLYVTGNALAVYLHSGRRAPTRWVYSWLITDRLRPRVLRDLAQHPPAAVVLSGGYKPEQAALTEAVRAWLVPAGYRRAQPPLPGDYELYLRPDRLDRALAAGATGPPALPPTR